MSQVTDETMALLELAIEEAHTFSPLSELKGLIFLPSRAVFTSHRDFIVKTFSRLGGKGVSKRASTCEFAFEGGGRVSFKFPYEGTVNHLRGLRWNYMAVEDSSPLFILQALSNQISPALDKTTGRPRFITFRL